MGTCNASDNVVLSFPELVTPPGTPQICVPLTVQNYNTVSSSFSISFDPTVLLYTGIQNINPQIGGFTPGSNVNTQQSALGELGVLVYNSVMIGAPINIVNGQSLFEVCFQVIGPLGSCSPLGINNFPTPISIENAAGLALAVTVDTGQICVNYQPFTVNVVEKDTACSGIVTVTAHGGKPTYDVVIKKVPNGPTSLTTITTDGGTFVSPLLTNGVYSVCIRDSSGIGTEICDTVTINIPTLGTSLDLTQMPACFGDSTGSATANVFINGSIVTTPGPNYSFTWNPAKPNAQVVNVLKAGNIAVTVTDATTGCVATASGTLGQPSQIKRQNLSVTDATCSGVCDGSISYTVAGGTALPASEYTYKWTYSAVGNPGSVVAADFGQGNPINLTGKCAGTYYVTITDANGCTLTDSVLLKNLRTISVNQKNLAGVSCNGLMDGSVCIQVTSVPAAVNPSYAYFWTPPGSGTVSGGAGADTSCYTNLGAGKYKVLAIDGQGCMDTASFTITQPNPLVMTAQAVQNPGCNFLNNGKIQVGATGGTPVYNFKWNDSNMSTGPILQNVPAGTYCVTVTDIRGCTDTLCETLKLPPPPPFTIDSVPVKCGMDGCLSINAPAAVTYSWTILPAGTVIGTTAQVCNLNGGTYAVVIQDGGGCKNTDTLVLGTRQPLFLKDTTFTQPSCFGLSDGLISVGMQGGNPPYTYAWTPTTPPQTSPTLINVAAGFYTLTVKDSKGCSYTTELQLKQPPQIKNTFSQVKATGCYGINDGQATATATYMTTPPTTGTFTYSWDDNSPQSNKALRNDLYAGIHHVTIQDNHNCFIIDSVLVGTPPKVIATSAKIDSISCFGVADGAILVAGGGGNGGPFQYIWSPNANSNTTAFVSNLGPGTYKVTITDVKNCVGDTTITLTQPPAINVLATGTNPSCFGSDDGSTLASVSGGNIGKLKYAWANSQGTVIDSLMRATNLKSGPYTVTVTDGHNCTGTASVTLVDPPQIQGHYLPFDALKCHGDQTTFTVDSIWGLPGANFQFSIDYGVTLDVGFPVSLGGGMHTITYIQNNTCTATETINIPEPDPIVISFDPPTIEVNLGESAVLLPKFAGPVVDSFIWTPSALLLHPELEQPTTNTYETTTYTITGYDANLCSATASILVTIDPKRDVYLPNIFHANNPRGLDDHFAPQIGPSVDVVNFMQVYDRWGELLYELNNFKPPYYQPSFGWDGKYKGDWVQPGVYIYQVEVKFLDGRVLLYRGDVTVIR
jgi:hypothetical protein